MVKKEKLSGLELIDLMDLLTKSVQKSEEYKNMYMIKSRDKSIKVRRRTTTQRLTLEKRITRIKSEIERRGWKVEVLNDGSINYRMI